MEENLASLGSWLIAKRTLVVLNHTRVLRAIFAVYQNPHTISFRLVGDERPSGRNKNCNSSRLL